MQKPNLNFHIKGMNILFVMFTLGLGTTAYAAGHEHSVKVHNGTTDEIVEASVSPAGRCDGVKCEGWVNASDSLPMKPQKDGGVLSLPKSGADPVCNWDIKISTQKLFSGEPSQDHIFRNVDLCLSNDITLSFVRVSAGMFAIQSYKGEQGRTTRIALPTQNNQTRWAGPDIIKQSGELGVGALFYNGLEQDITGIQVARADQCDAYICGEWAPRAENLLPLQPHGAIAALSLKEDVCKLDLQIASAPGPDGMSSKGTFKAVDFCRPPNKRSVLSIVKTVYGLLGIHMFEDAAGNVERIIYITES